MSMPHLHEDVLEHRAWLLSFVDLSAGSVVVDLGCGRGEDLLALAGRASRLPLRLVGLDSSEQSLVAARTRADGDPRLHFQQHHVPDPLPFEDGSIDVVYSNNLLECIHEPAVLASEIVRVLRPGGQLVIGHWDWDSQVFDGTDKPRIRRLVHAYADWQQAWMEHSDGWMGRRLWGVFGATGHFTGSVHARVLINTRYAAPWFGFANAQAFRSLAGRGLASTEDVEQFEQEQTTLDRQGRYFYSISGYAYVGKRSPAT